MSVEMKCLMLAAVLTAANILFKLIAHSSWESAFERSYFQCIAVLMTYLVVIRGLIK